MITLTFVRFMHFVDGQEVQGIAYFPVENENVTFTEEQLLEILKLNGYDATRIIHTNEDDSTCLN